MAGDTEKSELLQIAEILLAHGVEFIVVGGQAETIFGSARVTADIDLCYRRTKDNLKRLAAALHEIKPTLRNAPKDLPFIIDEKTLALGNNFTFDTPFGDLDLLGFLEPLGDYEVISKRALTIRVGHIDLKVIHIDDLIAIKQYLQRPKDRDSLMHLLAIKKIQSESQ
jgi:predicted nucleotidyltransferase